MNARQSIKTVTGRSLWLRYSLLAPWRMARAAVATVTKRVESGEHRGSPEDRQAYAQRAVTLYKQCLGIEHFYGKAAEVGPGDVCETSRLMVDDGCSEVHAVDRFAYPCDSSPGVHRHQDAAERFFIENGSFDFIVSCAVMEHLYDPIKALRTMAIALNRSGAMVHYVDCRDHERFSDSMHDLSFLRIPPALHYPLKINSGLNRVRLSAYVEAMQEMRMESKILVTSLSGVAVGLDPPLPFGEIPDPLLAQSRANLAAIRPKLASPFREMPDTDLLISGFALVIRYPTSTKA